MTTAFRRGVALILLAMFPALPAWAVTDYWYLGIADNDYGIENDEYSAAIQKWENWQGYGANHYILIDEPTNAQVTAAIGNYALGGAFGFDADDVLLYTYSGHTGGIAGGSVADDNGDETAVGNFALTPDEENMQNSDGFLRDDFVASLFKMMPAGSSLVTFMNTCHGGGYWGGTNDFNTIPDSGGIGSVPETVGCPGADACEAALQLGALNGSADRNRDGMVKLAEWDTRMRRDAAAAAQLPFSFNNFAVAADRVLLMNYVPEPSAAMLFAVGGTLILCRRREKKC